MTHTYKISGMTCGNCEAQVKSRLLTVTGVLSADVSQKDQSATIDMENHVPLQVFQKALGENSKYIIEAPFHNETKEQTFSWFKTYKPVLLIFGYILGISVLAEIMNGSFSYMRWMNHFMGGFFIIFSFFKMLNLKGFAESYAMYDILAKQWNPWGFIYAFLELALGLLFLSGAWPVITNSITLLVMSVSLVGVLQSVLNKKRIKCACLGDIFNLPMSTVTIVEDALMVVMSTIMLIMMA
jgi:copper chaperone CopZ